MTNRYIEAPDLSNAWLRALNALVDGGSPYKDVHVILRITDPTLQVPAIRQAAQSLIDRINGEDDKIPDIDTTRNTIFPAAFARRTAGAVELGAYYRDRYPELMTYNNNRYGTYFGRMVSYPTLRDGYVDQIADTVQKIRHEVAANTNKSSRYEISIYSPAEDRRRLMSFPCLAHLSVHLHKSRVHMQAVYRNESLVPRAYGNYLGLAELQRYIAEETGTATGELLMTLGHVEVGVAITPVKAMLRELG